MKPYYFHPLARQELVDAVEHYERQREGLGESFLDELEAAVRRIQMSPETWPRLSESVRRCRTRRFLYAVVYRSTSDAIEIVAVMHLHRHPDTWKGR